MDTTLPFADKAIEIIREYVETRHNGNVRAAAEALGMDPYAGVLNRWLRVGKGQRLPSLSQLGPVMDKIGATLVGPDEKFSPDKKDVFQLKITATLKQLQLEAQDLRRERDEARGAASILEKLLRAKEKRGEPPARSSPSRSNKTG